MTQEIATTNAGAIIDQRWLVAEKILGCTMLPDYIKSPADVFILMDLAMSQGKSIFQVANDNYIIKGKIAKKSEAVIRDINASGRLDGVLKFEERTAKDENGNVTNRWVRAYGKEKATGEILYGTWITTEMVEREKWSSNTKWQSMPEQMYRYRAATFWNRLYNSDICIQTIDEVEDIATNEAQTPQSANSITIGIPAAETKETKQQSAAPAQNSQKINSNVPTAQNNPQTAPTYQPTPQNAPQANLTQSQQQQPPRQPQQQQQQQQQAYPQRRW